MVLAEQGESREYLFLKGLIAALAIALSGQAQAAPNLCRLPARIDVPDVQQPAKELSRTVPVAGYTLALSWSPQFCRSHPDDGQCDRRNGDFGFILHGLWPEGTGSNYPQWCAASPAPIPEAVARDQFCTQPSAKLMAHEWAKHGTCATSSPADYFAASRKLFDSVRFPDMNALSRRPLDVGGFKRLMSAANPRIMPSAITVSSDRKGDWLREVRICLSKAMLPEPCPRGRSGGAPDGAALKIWRGAN
jgi:ribonuclease T2